MKRLFTDWHFNEFEFQGKPADFFLLILEGRVEVTIGREGLVFESGPFSHFGSQALAGITMSNIGKYHIGLFLYFFM